MTKFKEIAAEHKELRKSFTALEKTRLKLAVAFDNARTLREERLVVESARPFVAAYERHYALLQDLLAEYVSERVNHSLRR